MKRKQSSLIAVLILALVLAACAAAVPDAAPAEGASAESSGDGATTPQEGGVLVVARPADANQHLGNAQLSNVLAR